ncbi:MAG TPA: ATP-binding protein, partial [bacterium]
RTVSILSNQFDLKNISAKIKIADDLPAIKADANQLQQVLMNLFVNAVDAIDETGGEIYVSVNNGKLGGMDCITIEVTDYGCGIPQENLSKIFEPFYTTKGQKGTGLGLAVVWGIVEKHEGKIEVKSEVDKGTTFTLRLPVDGTATGLIKEKEQ